MYGKPKDVLILFIYNLIRKRRSACIAATSGLVSGAYEHSLNGPSGQSCTIMNLISKNGIRKFHTHRGLIYGKEVCATFIHLKGRLHNYVKIQ